MSHPLSIAFCRQPTTLTLGPAPVAGVPPAFRVNGEIIIADEDALTETDITEMAESLLNEQQSKVRAVEWEL